MPLSRRRVALLVLSAVVGLLVALAVLLGWQALRVNTALQDAVDDASQLRTALQGADEPRIEEALERLQGSAALARERTDGVLWSIATVMPAVGDDAEGVRVSAAAVDDLAGEDGLAPLVRVATRFDELAPRDGRIDISAVEDLQAPVQQAAGALAAARDDLAGLDSSGFVQRFRDQFRSLRADVGDAASAMDAAAVATELLPAALGGESPRTYLLVFQNNAEIRATGGLPGALATIRARDGELSLGRQASASSFGERDSPVLPLTKDEKDIWGNIFGTYVQDANFTPDWPRAAELIKARWEETYPERFDGVLTLDTVAISYLLEVTGPITVGGYEITSDNAVDVLLNQVYLDIANPAEQDALFQAVAAGVFDSFRTGQVDNPRDLLQALRTATEEGRLYVNLTDEEEQATIADRRVAGAATSSDGTSDRIDVTMVDGTGSKMSYYVTYDVSARATSCAAGKGRYTISATLRSTAPPDAADLPPYITGGGQFGVPAGTVFTQARIFTPSGGTVRSLTVDGNSIRPLLQPLGDRESSSGSVFLEPGQVGEVVWEIEVPRGDLVLPVRVTPSLEDEDESSMLRAACG